MALKPLYRIYLIKKLDFILVAGVLVVKTSDVLEHKWRASLKTILFLYE